MARSADQALSGLPWYGTKPRQDPAHPALYGHPKFAPLECDDQDERLEQVQHIEVDAVAALNKSAMDDSEERQRLATVINAENDARYVALLEIVAKQLECS